jgi:hypothetical protein
MAQDFAAAFALGENDTTISTVDADGVALAAIQGLNAKVEAMKVELAELRAARDEIAVLKATRPIAFSACTPPPAIPKSDGDPESK